MAFLNCGTVIMQGLFLQQWFPEARAKPLELITGLSIFSTAAAGGAIAHVASTSFMILFIASIVNIRSWPSAWRNLSSAERVALVSLGLYFFSAVIAYYNVIDQYEYIKHLGKYANFLYVIPIYLLISKAKINLLPYLIAGAIASGPIYLGAALLSIAGNPDVPAKGAYHHITFGDMAMLSAMLMLSLLITMDAGKIIRKNKSLKIMMAVSILCLLYASILSHARGAWLALPACLFVLLSVAVWYKKIRLRTIFIAFIVLTALIVITPVKEILSERVQSAVHEIELFQNGAELSTSIGNRLAMWHIALNVWKEYPIVGTGPGDFEVELLATQARGMYTAIERHSSVHNIFLQALATTGTIGFVLLILALFIVPFRLYIKVGEGGLNVAGLSGIVALVAFAVFGLTESWVLRSPPSTVYLLYFVVLSTAAFQEADTIRSNK
jgi:O-antigen ligase